MLEICPAILVTFQNSFLANRDVIKIFSREKENKLTLNNILKADTHIIVCVCEISVFS